MGRYLLALLLLSACSEPRTKEGFENLSKGTSPETIKSRFGMPDDFFTSDRWHFGDVKAVYLVKNGKCDVRFVDRKLYNVSCD